MNIEKAARYELPFHSKKITFLFIEVGSFFLFLIYISEHGNVYPEKNWNNNSTS